MMDEIYQEIYNTIFPLLPNEWEQIVVRGVFGKEGKEIKYFIRDNTGKYSDCFSLGVEREIILQTSELIINALDRLRQTSEKQHWNVATIVINNDGDFKADFDYSNDVLFSNKYDSAWREYYLIGNRG